MNFSFNFLNRGHKRGLKIPFALKMKTTYPIEWSNGEVYHPILGNGGSCNRFFRIHINLPLLQCFPEGRFTPCN